MDRPLLNLSQDFNIKDFIKILNEIGFTSKEKANLNSIFNTVSRMDCKIDPNELKGFYENIDTNSDGKISDEEVSLSLNTVLKSFQHYTETEVKNFLSILKIYIKTTNVQNQKFKEPTINNNRFVKNERKTGGKFCEKWLEEDAYGSKTFEEWIANNNYEYDAKTAMNMVKQIGQKFTEGYKNHCSQAVTDTLQTTYVRREETLYISSDGEVIDDEIGNDVANEIVQTHKEKVFQGERQYYAYNNAAEYANNPNFKEIPHNIVSSMDLNKLPKGCIIIYDAGYKDDGKMHEYGHIGITDGKGYDLSYERYKIVTDHQQTHIRVFMPIIPQN